MPFSRVGMRTLVLHGPNGLLSTAFVLKSTGKYSSNVKPLALGSAFGRFGLQVTPGSTVATSGFTITIVGALTSQNPGKVGTSKFVTLVQATSANLGSVKFSTSIIPVTWIALRSTKFTTAAGRSLRVNVCAVPS